MYQKYFPMKTHAYQNIQKKISVKLFFIIYEHGSMDFKIQMHAVTVTKNKTKIREDQRA